MHPHWINFLALQLSIFNHFLFYDRKQQSRFYWCNGTCTFFNGQLFIYSTLVSSDDCVDFYRRTVSLSPTRKGCINTIHGIIIIYYLQLCSSVPFPIVANFSEWNHSPLQRIAHTQTHAHFVWCSALNVAVHDTCSTLVAYIQPTISIHSQHRLSLTQFLYFFAVDIWLHTVLCKFLDCCAWKKFV